MRNIHIYIESEYGKENVQIFRCWERMEYKMADFENHHRFSLRCLSKDIIPVGVRLKSNIKTPKGRYIVRKAERALLNERVRLINNSLTMFKIQWDTCINNLEKALDRETMNDCHEFIKVGRERRHLKTLERQLSKFHRLCQKNTTGHSSLEHGEDGRHGRTVTETRNNNKNIKKVTGINREDKDKVRKQEEDKEESNMNWVQNISKIPLNREDKDKVRKQEEDKEESNMNWVQNISKTPLTQVQEKLLSHGPNFVIVSKEPPTPEDIAAIEKACLKLPTGKAEELRGEVKAILKKKTNYKPNITKEEHWAIKELRRDNTRMVLTTDKGVSVVVMDKEDYNTKSEELLQPPTYQILNTDPTNRQKNKLISLLKSIKAEGGIDETTYKKLYPTGATTPKYYGLPKVHKKDTPLRPIVSSIGSVAYGTAKELSRILKPLVGRSTHHVRNNQDFIQSIEEVKVGTEECMMSYDVKAMFTSIPNNTHLTSLRSSWKKIQVYNREHQWQSSTSTAY